MRRSSSALLVLLTGCATTASNTAGSADVDTGPQKLAITNVIPFDIAACGPRALSLSPLTAEVLTGALLSRSPALEECFIDPTSREGAAANLRAKVTVSETGTAISVSGEGATAKGKACIETALQKLALQPLAAGKAPIAAEIPVPVGPQSVRLGDNAANDIAGTLRLGQLSWCDCYASIMTEAPPSLKANVQVGADGAVTIAIDHQSPVAQCLTGKMQAMKLGSTQTQLTWPVLLKNSYATKVDESAPAPLRFAQFEGMRAQGTADILVAAGQRVAAALAYDEQAQKYKKKPSKALLEELKQQCNQVIAGDDAQLGALNRLLSVLEQANQLAVAEKVKDAQWGQVEAGLSQQLSSTRSEVTRVEKQKQNDFAACPKTKY